MTRYENPTARSYFEELLPSLLATDALGGLDGRFEFCIERDAWSPGGTWVVDFDQRTVKAGGSDSRARPHVIVRAAEGDFIALLTGTMTPEQGLLSERLHLTGDVTRVARVLEALSLARAGAAREPRRKP